MERSALFIMHGERNGVGDMLDRLREKSRHSTVLVSVTPARANSDFSEKY